MFSPEEVDKFKRVCSSFGIDLSESMIKQFETYASLLLEWNRRIHLISKGDAKSDRILRHFVDSLLTFKAVKIPMNALLLDLGAGAGFPSIPIRIVREDIRPVLIESMHKKVLFLRKLNQVLGIDDISVLDIRAEELKKESNLLDKFDLTTAKALGTLKVTVKHSAPLMKVGGILVSYKGRGVEKEISETQLPSGFRVRDVQKIDIPEMSLIRWLVVVEKIR